MRCWCGSMCRRARGASSRSAPTPAGSPAPTGSACPSRASLSLDLPVGTGTPNRGQFDEWRRALPQPLATPAHYVFEGGRVRLAIPLPADVPVRQAYVFPITENVIDYEGAAVLSAVPAIGWWSRCRPRRRRGTISTACWRSMAAKGCNFMPCPAPFRRAGTPLGGAAGEPHYGRCSARSSADCCST